MKVILQNRVKFKDEEKKMIESLGYSIEYYEDKEISGDVFVGIIYDQKYQKQILKDIKGLKYIQSIIAGFDALDMEAIKSHNVLFSNASGVGSAPIAEYVVLNILDYYKRGSYYRQLSREGVWGSREESDVLIDELYSKRVMVLGTGHIGVDIAKRLKAFNTELIGINSNGRPVDFFDEVYALSEVHNHLKDTDVVVGALPLNAHTENLYNEEFFKHMKEGSIFMNVGRGPSLVVDDLVSALDKNVAHAYLDVLPIEPLAKNSPLWRHKQISITPHNSSSSNYVKTRTKHLIIDNLRNYKQDKALINQVL